MPYDSNRLSDLDIESLPPSNGIAYISIDDTSIERPVGVTQYIKVQLEPLAVYPHMRDFLISNYSHFDKIVSYDEEVLSKCPNAVHYLYGTTWISSEVYNNIDISIKKPCISSLTGWKSWAVGHAFRHLLYNAQKEIPLPITWYRSSAGSIIPEIGNNPILTTDPYTGKPPLFLEYQFSLVIENSRQNNYFTEKLIDCLITKTIPIYCGCPNISKWFDTTGWIILETETIEEVIQKCNILPVYSENMDVINTNYETAKMYSNLTRNIGRALEL